MPENAIKKIERNNRGRGKKNGGEKSRIFCDEPKSIFSKKKCFYRVFELPCHEALKKRDKTNRLKKKK
jgi:hypothetical protein